MSTRQSGASVRSDAPSKAMTYVTLRPSIGAHSNSVSGESTIPQKRHDRLTHFAPDEIGHRRIFGLNRNLDPAADTGKLRLDQGAQSIWTRRQNQFAICDVIKADRLVGAKSTADWSNEVKLLFQERLDQEIRFSQWSCHYPDIDIPKKMASLS